MARGALIVDHVLDQSQVRAMYAVGLLTCDEPFDPDIHTDARTNPKLVKKGFWDSLNQGKHFPVVYDRITWLMKQVSAP